jgi:hypothetical protein
MKKERRSRILRKAKTKQKLKSCEYPFPSEAPWEVWERGGQHRSEIEGEERYRKAWHQVGESRERLSDVL